MTTGRTDASAARHRVWHGSDAPPDGAFPLFHVMADIADWGGASLLGAVSDAPARVDAIVAADPAAIHALVYNLTPEPVRVTIGPLPGPTARVRTLNDRTAPAAAAHPVLFRTRIAAVVPLEDGRLDMTLAPHAIAQVDVDMIPGRRAAERDENEGRDEGRRENGHASHA